MISDPDRFDALSYYAVTVNGDRLPDWMAFDASTLTFAGTPGAADAGSHEILLIAADSSGAAAIGSLSIAVGGEVAAPESEPPAVAAEETVAISLHVQESPAPVRREDAIVESAPVTTPTDAPRRVGIPIDPLFREMQQRFDVLLQIGRANLGERYAEAIREFEERRVQQEETPPPPPPSDDEVAAWNSAMHAWHTTVIQDSRRRISAVTTAREPWAGACRRGCGANAGREPQGSSLKHSRRLPWPVTSVTMVTP